MLSSFVLKTKLAARGMRDDNGVGAVDRSYDLFEIFPDGSALWKGAVAGHEDGILKLKQLAAGTTNEVQLMHVPTKTLIATMNAPKS
jgi:hypothetical protein